jgi:hypothetical protein
MFKKWLSITVLAVVLSIVANHRAQSAESTIGDREQKIQELETSIKALSDQIQALRVQGETEKASASAREEIVSRLSAQMDRIKESPISDSTSWLNKLTLGGYGEIHGNFGNREVRNQIDLHRLVLYGGYTFNDWIRFHSETEIEHAFVSTESGGELSIEQAYVDFLLSNRLNVRAGRFLTPLGIVNRKHEPPNFNGVERSFFDRFIIPSTWFSDGMGVFGALAPSLKYEAYIVGGLNGSKFDGINGIREGRIEQSPSLHRPAVTARLDYYPFVQHEVPFGQFLRLGVSTFIGGLDNGNEGEDPGIGGTIAIYSGDVEYTIWKLDFKGALAIENISGARQIVNGAAKGIFGWNLEGGYHFLPDSLKKGKLSRSDAVAFVRYDSFNTQYRMPAGIARDPAGERNAFTTGVNFYLTPHFVLKGDYQIVKDHTGRNTNLWNLGMGWQL